MKLIEELSVVEELVLNRASPAEIRGYILAMRPGLEQILQKAADYEALEKEHAKLKLELEKSKSDAAKDKLQHQMKVKNLEDEILAYSLGNVRRVR